MSFLAVAFPPFRAPATSPFLMRTLGIVLPMLLMRILLRCTWLRRIAMFVLTLRHRAFLGSGSAHGVWLLIHGM